MLRAETTTIETIEEATGFQELRGEWDELLRFSSSNSFFLTWEWLYRPTPSDHDGEDHHAQEALDGLARRRQEDRVLPIAGRADPRVFHRDRSLCDRGASLHGPLAPERGSPLAFVASRCSRPRLGLRPAAIL